MMHFHKIFFYFCFFFSFCYVVKGNPQELLLKAEKLYNEKKYEEALKIYEQIEKDGWQSADFYYNMGNIYYRLNKLGYAIWKYEKALKLQPGSSNISHNLELCYSKTIDKLEVNENFFIRSIKEGFIFRFNERTWGILSIVFSFVSVLLILVSVLLLTSLRPLFVPFAILFLIFSITSGIFGKMVYKETHRSSFAVVLDKEVPVCAEPLEKSFVKFRLHEGAKIRVEEIQSDYTLIKLSNGNEGWIKNSSLGFI
jgi:hypothetical protein